MTRRRLTDAENLGSLLAYEMARQSHERARRRASDGVGDLLAAVTALTLDGRARGTTSRALSGVLNLVAAAIDEGVARTIWLVVRPPNPSTFNGYVSDRDVN